MYGYTVDTDEVKDTQILVMLNKKQKYLFSTFFILLTSVLFQFCTSTGPETEGRLFAEIENVSCTEAWIKINTESVSLPTHLKVFERDSLFSDLHITSTSDIIYLDKLLTARLYKFQLIIDEKTQCELQVTTVDTTDHDLTWETYSFGGGTGSSRFTDVAIIDEDNIWAVGEIHTEDTDKFDSNGVWIQQYNSANWDGKRWMLSRIMFYRDPDQPSSGKTSSQASSVFVFENGEYLISSNVQVALFKKDGGYTIKYLNFAWEDRFEINSVWGISISDFYVIGNYGNIAHYLNGNWSRIETGTDVNLTDIQGSRDGTAWACGNENFKPTVLLQIKNNDAVLLYNSRDNIFDYKLNELSGNLYSIWSDIQNDYYVLSAFDLYRIKDEKIGEPKALWRNSDSRIGVRRVRGTGLNNIFTAGYQGTLNHYNGVNWKTYTELSGSYKTYNGLSVKDNITVAAGQAYENGISDKAIITITKIN